MFVIYINDIPTDVTVSNMPEAIKWIESNSNCYPSGFSLTEWYDPDSNRIFNIIEIEEKS